MKSILYKSLTYFLIIFVSVSSSAELVYLAKVNFGGKIFNDIITLSEPIGHSKSINGSLTVPGVFTTKFVGVKKVSFETPNLEFQTTAIEKGKKIFIYGYLELEQGHRLSGYLNVKLSSEGEPVTANLSGALIYEERNEN